MVHMTSSNFYVNIRKVPVSAKNPTKLKVYKSVVVFNVIIIVVVVAVVVVVVVVVVTTMGYVVLPDVVSLV